MGRTDPAFIFGLVLFFVPSHMLLLSPATYADGSRNVNTHPGVRPKRLVFRSDP